MAKRTTVTLVDDLDGTHLEVGDGETVSFALDGKAWEIDLTNAHAAELRAALAPFIAAGRKAAAAGTAAPRAARVKDARLPAIKAWADENGHDYPKRGRVPNALIAAYEQAHA